MNRSLTGKTTGLVVDSGECLTSCFPISGGTINKHAVKTIPFGGRDVTEYINRHMAEEWGLSLSSYGQVRRATCRPCAEDCSILSDSIHLQQAYYHIVFSRSKYFSSLPPPQNEVLRQMKEDLCYCGELPEKQGEQEYKLPDGQVTTPTDPG
jgi:hypothetical protein